MPSLSAHVALFCLGSVGLRLLCLCFYRCLCRCLCFCPSGSDSFASCLKSFAVQFLLKFWKACDGQLATCYGYTTNCSKVHQQVVSDFGCCLTQHHADFRIVIPALMSPVSGTHAHAGLLDAFSHLSADSWLATTAGRICRPAFFGAFSATNCLQISNPLRKVYSVVPVTSQASSCGLCRPQGVQCVAQRSDEHGGLGQFPLERSPQVEILRLADAPRSFSITRVRYFSTF